MGDRTRGLYGKFRVRRTDGRDGPGQKHDGCDYFVLDLTHDPHAMSAIRAYAAACRGDYPLLAADLVQKCGGRTCRVCGCTDDNCKGCIERTGEPCQWVEEDLCSACVETYLFEAAPDAPRLPDGVTSVVAATDGAKLGTATWWGDRMAVTVPRDSETDHGLRAIVVGLSILPWLRYDPQRGVAVLTFPEDAPPAPAARGAQP